MEGRAKKRRICENDGTAGGASSTHTSTEGQGMDTSSGYDYEVFLSFRGPDTRAGFTDFLYTNLKDAGIRVFKDDEELRVGEEFAPELLQAINQSKISIPIFSKGYASSVWCLKELVQMVECQKTGRQKIMPIFYDVAPSEVRYQTGGYAEAFLAHEKNKRHDKKTMQEWKDALRAIGALNGWDLHSQEKNRREGKFAKELTHKVFRELKKAYLVVSDCLVSVDNHVDAIMEMIGAGTSESRIIGIHGMGGIGKTTIAKIIYNKVLHDFENCCFLSDIRETSKKNGIQHLQNQLISKILKMECVDIKDIDEGTQTINDRLLNKKVLLLLDDVEEQNHIKAFVGNGDWLGRGSKVIITTRNKDILEIPPVNCNYELSCMDDDQSLRLFSKYAFRKDYPLDEDIDQSMRAIGIAGGLPLTLEVIGSLLSCTKKQTWDFTLKKLELVPHPTVQSKLKISYDALDARQQNIFLDIACLFIGYDKDVLVHFWDEYNYFSKVDVEVLHNMCLIKINEDNEVWMHDQLRDFGREIVCQKSDMKIHKQSRVWDPKVGQDLLRKHKEKTEVEALCLKLDDQWQNRFTYGGFASLSDLRFLEVSGSMKNFSAEESLLWHESPSNVPSVNENSDLLPQLRWLSWHDIPPTFNITNFSMEDVVFLDLSSSKITHDWKGWSHMEVMKNLKVMDLSYCQYLKRTPNFSAHSNLERLSLCGCVSLVKIDESICQLKSLVSLDVKGCWRLQRLPDKLGRDLASLEYLYLNDCRRLDELPHTIGNLKSLIELHISKTGIKKLPDSIGNLESLIELHISGTRIEKLPDSIGNLKNLKVVRMRRNTTKKIPYALWMIEKLEEIDALSTLLDLDEIGAEDITNNLDTMEARNMALGTDPGWLMDDMRDRHKTLGFDVEIGDGISKNQSLRILRLEKAEIKALPPRFLPESLIILELSALRMHTFPNLSSLTNLKRLKLTFVPRDGEPVEEHEMPPWIGELSKLEYLLLASPHVTALPTEISLLPRLQRLNLDAPNLRDLPSLPSSLLHLVLRSDLRCLPCLPSSLLSLDLRGCRSCRSTGDISNLKELSTLDIRDCAISEIRGLDGLQNLGQLWLMRLPLVEIHFDLSNSNELWQIRVADCSKLVAIQGKLPPNLRSLNLESCGSLRKLPDLSNLKSDQVNIACCRKLDVASLYSKMIVRSVGDRDGLEGEDKSEEQIEHGSEGEDDESECEIEHGSEGEGESKSKIEHGSEDEGDESECEIDG